jgi:hypothetical protein
MGLGRAGSSSIIGKLTGRLYDSASVSEMVRESQCAWSARFLLFQLLCSFLRDSFHCPGPNAVPPLRSQSFPGKWVSTPIAPFSGLVLARLASV